MGLHDWSYHNGRSYYNEWNSAFHATQYDKCMQMRYPLYREAARTLVEMAAVRPEMTVVDLACGTGLVAELLLATDVGEIIGIDNAAAMLERTRNKVLSKRVRLIETPAESLDTQLQEHSVDVVLCNASFLWLQPRDTLLALQKILKTGGSFLFTVPYTIDLPAERQPPSVTLLELIRQIAREEYGEQNLQKMMQNTSVPPLEPLPTLERMGELLQDTTLDMAFFEDIDFEESAEQAFAFLHTAAMTQRALYELDQHKRITLLKKAYPRFKESHDPKAMWKYPWRFYKLIQR